MQQTYQEMTPAADYQRNRYRSVDQSWVNWREQRLLTRILTSQGLSGRSLLDVPCGYGRLFPLYTRLGMTVTGVDQDPDMMALIPADDTPTHTRRVLCGSLFALPFADATFDVVSCIRLFHHQNHKEEQHRLFSELARVSRRHILISYYRYDFLHAWSCLWRWRRKGRLPALLSDVDLGVLAGASGLQVLATQALMRYGHMQTFSVLGKRPSDSRCNGVTTPLMPLPG